MQGPAVTREQVEAEVAETHFFTAWEGAQFAFWCKAAEIMDEQALELYGEREPHRDGPLGRVTMCVLVMRNGFTAVGVNEGPVSPVNHDPELGKKYAYEQALDKVWLVLGYQLKDRLAAEESKQSEVNL